MIRKRLLAVAVAGTIAIGGIGMESASAMRPADTSAKIVRVNHRTHLYNYYFYAKNVKQHQNCTQTTTTRYDAKGHGITTKSGVYCGAWINDGAV